MKNSIILFMMLMTFSSCMVKTHVMVLQPAQIDLGDGIDTLSVAIRIHGDERRAVSWPFSSYQAYYENDGIRSAAMSFVTRLQENPRFKIAPGIKEIPGARRQTYGELISYNTVENITSDQRSDALVVLEVFDIDTREYSNQRDIIISNGKGGTSTLPEFEVENEITISLGWRIYDGASGKVIDQFSYYDRKRFNATGPSVQEATYSLPQPETMVNQAATEAGEEYAFRVAPFWFKARRVFYGSHDKNPRMRDAKALARIGDWNGAMQIWETLMNNADKEFLGKLTYNIALAHEIQGELDEAIYWVEQAYLTHHNPKARTYFLTLKERQVHVEAEEQRLNDKK